MYVIESILEYVLKKLLQNICYSYVLWISFGVRIKAIFNGNIRRQGSEECSYLILLFKTLQLMQGDMNFYIFVFVL